jgi:hypothetical protein
VGVVVESATSSLDHVNIQNFDTSGILTFAGAHALVIGPGVVVTGSRIDPEVNGGGTGPVTATGWLGPDHT